MFPLFATKSGMERVFAVFALRLRRTEPTTSGEVGSLGEGGSGTSFAEHYACRGTSLIEAGKLSGYRIFVGGTGAVSRYKLSRSQKSVMVQDLNCGQMSVSGYKNHYEFVLGAGAKAKSVTSPLIIPSVLGGRSIYIYLLVKLLSC